jgi:hypothetical protein
MAYVQRFIAWCISVIFLIAVVAVGYAALTHPAATTHIITSVVGALVTAGTGAAAIVINVVTYISGLLS